MKRIMLPGVMLGLMLGSVSAANADQPVIIKCAGSCDVAAQNVTAAGGSVTYRYKYVDAIAATMPLDLYARGSSIDGVEHVIKDVMIERPRAVESLDLGTDFQILDVAPADVVPADFL